MGFLYEKLDIKRENLVFALPEIIKSNLNPMFEMRPYQERAFENFAFWFEDPKNPRPKPSQALFHMATGSGKTLIMAGLILYLYRKGYRDFLFFVNLANIVQKTKENFLNPLSGKFLFAKEIVIDGERVPVREVENFQDSDAKAINICFTTTQGLHTDIWNAKENAVTLEDFAERKVVLISDEAHHLNADTRKMNKGEDASAHSWEETVERIFRQNAENLLLEFTATCDLTNSAIKAKYEDKVIFNYPLSEFRKDGYSKEIMTLRTDVSVMDRAMLAVVMSQYRMKVFQSRRISVKPIVLFKARTVAESKAFMDEFAARIAKLTGEEVRRLSRLVGNPTLAGAFKYFKDQGITHAALANELKLEFAPERCISANDDREADERQIALNSLEAPENPYRAVFEVKKLDEGWDVLNLFDIVRLYETRQSGGKAMSSTTIAEAQLIGRGSRYCPFAVDAGQDKFKRKYDSDATNRMRICEELYYHCQIDPKYIAELHGALREIGLDPDKRVMREYVLKECFKKDDLYKSGVVFVNGQREKPRKGAEGMPQSLKDERVEYKESLGSSRESAVMEDGAAKEDMRAGRTEEFTIAGIAWQNYAFAWRSMCKFPALRFDRLKRQFPDLESSRQFIESGDYAGGISIGVTAMEMTPATLCAATEAAFGKIAAAIAQLGPEYEGTKEFKGRKLHEAITDKTCFFTDIETATGGLGVSQKDAAKWPLDLSREDWFAFEDNFGTTEEKSFVKFFKERIVEKLKLRFAKVWLVRNERQLCIYSFKDGRRFEPDYILFLKRKRKDKKTEQIQVFVEPKGEGFIATDKWKEDFLLELENEGRLMFDIKDADYRIRGCHFYNETDSTRKTKVRDEILELCGESGEHEVGAMPKHDESNRYLIYLPLYSLKAACGRFGEQANVEIEDWVEVLGVKRRNEKLYVVRADGDSMEPLIHNGDYCVFEYRDGACENDDVVLAQYSDSVGDDAMGTYVIKKFCGKKKGDEYVSVKLVSINEDYDDIKLKNGGRDVKQYKIVGVLRRGIKVV